MVWTQKGHNQKQIVDGYEHHQYEVQSMTNDMIGHSYPQSFVTYHESS